MTSFIFRGHLISKHIRNGYTAKQLQNIVLSNNNKKTRKQTINKHFFKKSDNKINEELNGIKIIETEIIYH